jgi:hypothetical protein
VKWQCDGMSECECEVELSGKCEVLGGRWQV